MPERIFTINLRKATLKVPRGGKSKRSVAIVREFLKTHMKVDEVKIGKSITEKIWKGGAIKIPGKIRIKAVETEEGEGEKKRKVVKAELLGIIPEELKEKREEIKKKVEEKSKEESIGKKETETKSKKS